MDTVSCPECGKMNKATNAFCIGCGFDLSSVEPVEPEQPEEDAPIENACPECGKVNKPGNLFCIGCGAQLASDAGQGESEDAEQSEPARVDVCPQCGKPFVPGDVFCVFCGEQLSAQANQAASPHQASNPVRTLPVVQQTIRQTGGVKHGETSIPVWMVIAIVVIIVVLAALLLFSVFRPSGNNAADQTAASNTAVSTSTVASSESSSGSSAASSGSESGSAAASSSASAQASTSQSSDYVLADSNTRYYSRAELERLSTLDLYHARNEIYARHGRGFKNEDLRAYFSSKSWYHETVSPESFNESVLNDYERQNANLMLEIEKAKNSPYI